MKRTVITLLALGMLLAACTSGASSVDQDVIAGEESRPTTEQSGESPSDAGGSRDDLGVGQDTDALAGRKIIRQGSMVVEAADTNTVFDRIVNLVESSGGFVASSDLERTDGDTPPRIEVTLRLPSGSLSSTILAIGGMVDEVLSRQLGSSDVTAQYVDIEARLRNLRTLEAELLLLLTDVRDVSDPEASDLLLVFDRLQNVRLQIEQLQGQLQVFDDQVELSTLRVSIVPPPPVIEITDESWSASDQVRSSLASLVRVLENLANLAIWAGVFLVPVLAIVIIPIGLIYGFTRRRSHERDPVAEQLDHGESRPTDGPDDDPTDSIAGTSNPSAETGDTGSA